VLGIAQSGPQLVADRYSYLSCLGWALLVGAGFLWFARSVKATKLTDFTLAMASALGVMVVVFLGVLTWQQSQVWHDTKHLWTHAISINRRSLFQSGGVQHNLG